MSASTPRTSGSAYTGQNKHRKKKQAYIRALRQILAHDFIFTAIEDTNLQHSRLYLQYRDKLFLRQDLFILVPTGTCAQLYVLRF
jgi:hypothetical protein